MPSDFKVIAFKQHDDTPSIVILLEEMLSLARADQIRSIVVGYTLRGQEGPNMAWRGIRSARDVADASLTCDLLKNLLHRGISMQVRTFEPTSPTDPDPEPEDTDP